jgi:iron complex transport system substrate-binding protein
MTTATARPKPRIASISGVAMLLLAVLMAFAMAAPQADAAKKKRIIAISPFAAQTMVQLGVKPYRVGQTIGATDRQRQMLRGIPALTLSHPNGPNLEVMAKLKPDLVLTSNQWKAGFGALRQLGIKVVVADPTSPNGVYKNVLKIGKILGKGKQANNLNKRIRSGLKSATRGITGARPKVLVVLGIGRTAMAFLGNSWGGQVVRMAGGQLVTGGAKNSGGFARISDEVVVAENPDRIILVPHGSSQDLDEIGDYIANNDAWKSTNAWKSKDIYVSGDNSLLQAGTDLGQTIRRVRTKSIKNW